MEPHATSSQQQLVYQSMTVVSEDAGVTMPSQYRPRPASVSYDPQHWNDVLDSFNTNGHETVIKNNMEFKPPTFHEDTSARLGAVNGASLPGPPSQSTSTSTSTSNSASSSSSLTAMSNAAYAQHWNQGPWTQHHPRHEYNPHSVFHSVPMPVFQSEQSYEESIGFGYGGTGLGIYMAPTSNPSGSTAMTFHPAPTGCQTRVNLHDDFGRQEMFNGSWRPETNLLPTDDFFVNSDDDRENVESADPCYAQLLYKCLKEAPDYTLSLRELYEWVSQHSQKAKDPKNRGWQNSVRHNLSMNAAFIRVPHGQNPTSKKGSLWRLTDEALRDGVISTTRYRKDPKRKPEKRNAQPALNRQASGAKGGRATRDASRLRQQQHRIRGLPSSTRFRRSARNIHGSQCSLYSPHSAPASPAGYPSTIQTQIMTPAQPPSHISSPYFNVVEEPLQFGDELTPTAGFYHPMQQPDFMPLEEPSKRTSFELFPLDPSQSIFGNHDPEIGEQNPFTPTASFTTEQEFMAEDNVPQLMSCNTSRETTTFM